MSIYSTVKKELKANMSELTCDFGKLLNKPCNKVGYVRKVGLKMLGELDDDTRHTLLWRSRFMDKNKEEMTMFSS